MRLALVLLLFFITACTTYEYEEEVFLEVDGSGRFRISGSREALGVLHPLSDVSTDRIRDYFDEPQIELDSVRETERDGRTFIHVQGRFSDWNRFCEHPAFSGRRCALITTPDLLAIESTVPRPMESDLPTDADAPIAFRFHFPSTVRFHNSRHGIERGNIVRWQRSMGEHFGSDPLVIRARFEKRSVLETTVRVLLAATGLVVLAVSTIIVLMVRKGRRQLEEEAREP